MTNSTLLFIAGIGPGNIELISVDALHHAQISDVILVPRSNIHSQGLAENIIREYLPSREMIPVYFPMTHDAQNRSSVIISQLRNIKHILEGNTIFFPVIGDAMLYSTGSYLVDAINHVIPECMYEFVPGISAHSLAAALTKNFLAMSDEILTIIPGTASHEKISHALSHSDNIAIYKPSAIHNIHSLINPDDFSRIIRVDYAGFPQQKIYEGINALDGITEYMSIILLKK